MHEMIQFICTGDEQEDESNLKILAENIHIKAVQLHAEIKTLQSGDKRRSMTLPLPIVNRRDDLLLFSSNDQS